MPAGGQDGFLGVDACRLRGGSVAAGIMAKWIPLRSRPGTFKSRAVRRRQPAGWHRTLCGDPPRAHCATWELGRKITPSAESFSRRRSEVALLHLEIGDAVAEQAAQAIRLSRWLRVAARFNCCAAARPAGPDPTTATRLPVRTGGGSARSSPRGRRDRRWISRSA